MEDTYLATEAALNAHPADGTFGGDELVDVFTGAGYYVYGWVDIGTAYSEYLHGQGAQDPRGNESTIVRFTFAPPARTGARWEVTKAEFVPQAFDLDAGRVVDLNAALEQGATVGAVRDRIRDVILSRGAAQSGLVMAK